MGWHDTLRQRTVLRTHSCESAFLSWSSSHSLSHKKISTLLGTHHTMRRAGHICARKGKRLPYAPTPPRMCGTRQNATTASCRRLPLGQHMRGEVMTGDHAPRGRVVRAGRRALCTAAGSGVGLRSMPLKRGCGGVCGGVSMTNSKWVCGGR